MAGRLHGVRASEPLAGFHQSQIQELLRLPSERFGPEPHEAVDIVPRARVRCQRLRGTERADRRRQVVVPGAGVGVVFRLAERVVVQKRHARFRAEQADPSRPQAPVNLISVFGRLDQTTAAEQAYRRALEIQPDNSKLIQVMIVEYGRGRYYQAAAELASRAVKLKPYDLDVHLMAITAQRQAGDRAEGLKLAEQAHARWDKSARAAFEYGWHLQETGRFAEAEPLLRKAMALDPDYEEPFFFYGDWLVEQGRYEEALEPLRRAIEIRPDYMPARSRLGRALMGLERWDEALAELRTAVEQEPRHPQPHLLLSQIYFRQGDREKAREEKNISLRLRRENPALLEAAQGRPFP